MKFKAKCEIQLEGKPADSVLVMPEPDKLCIPLGSTRFSFDSLEVKEGQSVQPGQVLARDLNNYSVPLLAPRAGKVKLGEVENHIVLDEITQQEEEPYDHREDEAHIPQEMGSVGLKRYKLLALGAWQFVYDAHSFKLPDPFGTPRAVIVSTVNLEPYTARGEVQLQKRLANFTRGLEHLQSLLEYQPIYLVMPDINSEFSRQLRESVRGYAWVKPIQIAPKYPSDNFAVMARQLGFNKEKDSPVWAMRTEAILAIDRALTLSKPSTVRIISFGGPMVKKPVHLKVMPGYPIKDILADRLDSGSVRIIDGGVLTGKMVSEQQKGLTAECNGLTVLAEHSDREFLSFVRPGFDRQSYGKCYMSALRGAFKERLNTALRGELRPCVACGFCEEVCPAGIMPYMIHKTLYSGELEDVELMRVDLCVGCGMCSFVCPSKIDLRGEFVKAQEEIENELHAPEVQA